MKSVKCKIERALLLCFVLVLVKTSFGFYNPNVGRWTTRDPIEEKDSPNLYQFVGNNPVKNVDPHGMYTLGDAEDSLREKGVPMHGLTWHGNDYYTDTQVLNEWLELERSRGAWWTVLHKCPSKLCIRKNGKPVNPDVSKWKDPKKDPWFLNDYHPGGVYEMRSLPVDGHGNQCVYDGSGSIFIGPPTGGTVDWSAPSFWGYLFGHGPHDVDTYSLSKKLRRVPDYYSVRPSW